MVTSSSTRQRKGMLRCADWILDSGAFREIEQYGGYRHSPAEYAAEVNRLAGLNPGMAAAVSQDWMCEDFVLRRTGKTILDHQWLTIQRYDALHPLINGVYLLPVLQGYSPWEYARHIDMYGGRLEHGMYVGVGSLCKRNGNAFNIEDVLLAVKRKRPDLRLHGFGLKATALT